MESHNCHIFPQILPWQQRFGRISSASWFNHWRSAWQKWRRERGAQWASSCSRRRCAARPRACSCSRDGTLSSARQWVTRHKLSGLQFSQVCWKKFHFDEKLFQTVFKSISQHWYTVICQVVYVYASRFIVTRCLWRCMCCVSAAGCAGVWICHAIIRRFGGQGLSQTAACRRAGGPVWEPAEYLQWVSSIRYAITPK